MPGARLSDSAIVVASPDLLSSEFGEELVILSLRDGVYYGLDHVGARVWGLIKQPVALSVIRDTLVSEYDVDPKRCEQELRGLLESLAEQGLVEISG